ncbi:DNA polymerase III subunit epsilon [Ancylobacter dichloromethanicus]|uniref:DNA polymerase III subunit epsilon n=1 Tax=Ancylobacter dichloromethanicus TaxID=518825 RepID=A0A9W6JCM7_9HYPH|nr:DNA polymerase III subunit epsilon [Ancylobacter dichloromethanicus]MBS7554915.1 DNA polymerase III subunit epsilon [Ancylobacter dichloromethanicus]GLK73309.1 DNA polymerase III subunit epsilon [Ancylobacter dichloromethanicus]
MREIVLDTETTGLNPLTGDRLVEIGCVEIYNRIPTGQVYHVYLNPQRDMPLEAFNVHGLSSEFLADKPLFVQVVDDFLAFIGGDPLVIHNAAFDIGFINAELAKTGRPALTFDRVIDTLSLARRRHPGASNRLDDLMNRYGINSSRRTKHGALLDSELLAEVYAELCGGKQTALSLTAAETTVIVMEGQVATPLQRPRPLPPRGSEAEAAAHEAFIATLGENAIWNDYTAGS